MPASPLSLTPNATNMSDTFPMLDALLAPSRYYNSQRRQSRGVANGYSSFRLEPDLPRANVPPKVHLQQELSDRYGD